MVFQRNTDLAHLYGVSQTTISGIDNNNLGQPFIFKTQGCTDVALSEKSVNQTHARAVERKIFLHSDNNKLYRSEMPNAW